MEAGAGEGVCADTPDETTPANRSVNASEVFVRVIEVTAPATICDRSRWRKGTNRQPDQAAVYGRIVTLRITGAVTGLLMPPSLPSVVGVAAMRSTVDMPAVTLPKIT